MNLTPSQRTQAAAQQNPIRPRYEKLAPVKRRRLPPIRISSFIAIAAIAITGIYIATRTPGYMQTAQSTPSNPNDGGQVTQANPDFDALTPSDKEVAWTRLAPPNSTSFYAFSDRIGGISIRISEQPLPDDFINDPVGELAQLARNYNANRTINVDATAVHVGTSVKGQQSLIFIKDSLLIMITSDSTLNDKQWTDYITTLQ